MGPELHFHSTHDLAQARTRRGPPLESGVAPAKTQVSENPQRGLRENNNKNLTQKFASIYAETSTFWQWRFFSAHRRAADSATCLAVAIFILELVAPSLERASGMVAVLESKTHGSDCLIVLIAFITFIHEAVCVNPRGRMYDLRRARRGRQKGCFRGNVRIDCALCEPSVR